MNLNSLPIQKTFEHYIHPESYQSLRFCLSFQEHILHILRLQQFQNNLRYNLSSSQSPTPFEI